MAEFSQGPKSLQDLDKHADILLSDKNLSFPPRPPSQVKFKLTQLFAQGLSKSPCFWIFTLWGGREVG